MVGWNIPGIFKADAEKVDKEIKSLGKTVTPAELVKYARTHKSSELHKCFEWDDTAAAEKYRLQQAQKVIRCLVIIPEKEDIPQIREYQITTQRNTYSTSRTFLINKDEYESLLERALNELKAFERKYSNLSELEDIFAQIDAL